MQYDPRRLRPRRRQHWGVEPEPDLQPPGDATVRWRLDPAERKRVLWRDSATILVGVVLALLVGQVLLPRSNAVADASPSPLPSGVAVNASLGGGTPPPDGSTFGLIVDPSLGIDATPTPIPLITLSPTKKPAPGATPTPTPRITPKPTKKPPTPTPPPPTPTPAPTPTPPPHAVVTCGAPFGQVVTCTSSSTNVQNNSEVWDMGGPGFVVSGGNGSGSITWTYSDTPPFSAIVTLTVTGLDGSTMDSDTTQVDIT